MKLFKMVSKKVTKMSKEVTKQIQQKQEGTLKEDDEFSKKARYYADLLVQVDAFCEHASRLLESERAEAASILALGNSIASLEAMEDEQTLIIAQKSFQQASEAINMNYVNKANLEV